MLLLKVTLSLKGSPIMLCFLVVLMFVRLSSFYVRIYSIVFDYVLFVYVHICSVMFVYLCLFIFVNLCSFSMFMNISE